MYKLKLKTLFLNPYNMLYFFFNYFEFNINMHIYEGICNNLKYISKNIFFKNEKKYTTYLAYSINICMIQDGRVFRLSNMFTHNLW